MGDRALIILHANEEHSPVCYLHWGGSEVAKLLQATRERMADRVGDVPYAFARLVGLAHERVSGNLSLGVWNAPATIDEAKSKDYSHGDAGVFLVDVSGEVWHAEAFNGYGFGDGLMTLDFFV